MFASSGVGLVQVLCLGGFVFVLLLPAARQAKPVDDDKSHRRLMRELRRHD